MAQTWSGWKRFPDAQIGDSVEAPIGPGVYEVRHTKTGQLMAFGHAANVANAIAELKFDGGVGAIARLFGKEPLVSRVSDLEYRTCAAATRAAAADGPAADRLETPYGCRLGGPSPELRLIPEQSKLWPALAPAVSFLRVSITQYCPRTRRTPSPRWGEGWGEEVQFSRWFATPHPAHFVR